MAKFKAGDTITDGRSYYTIKRVAKDSYQFEAGYAGTGLYMPTNLIDRLWTFVDNEGEIVE